MSLLKVSPVSPLPLLSTLAPFVDVMWISRSWEPLKIKQSNQAVDASLSNELWEREGSPDWADKNTGHHHFLPISRVQRLQEASGSVLRRQRQNISPGCVLKPRIAEPCPRVSELAGLHRAQECTLLTSSQVIQEPVSQVNAKKSNGIQGVWRKQHQVTHPILVYRTDQFALYFEYFLKDKFSRAEFIDLSINIFDALDNYYQICLTKSLGQCMVALPCTNSTFHG